MRREVSELHAELVRYNLVAWTAGNVSGRVAGSDLLVIKPSGVDYDAIAPDTMILCDLDGRVVEGDLRPSSDTAAHAYVYREMPDVGGVVHTHSSYASAWAARASRSHACSPAMADEFGGEIPVGPFALIGNDDIGKGIVATLSGSPLARGAHAEPRRLHDRPHGPSRGQGRGHVRGRRPHRPLQPAAGRAAYRSRRATSTGSTSATRTSTVSAEPSSSQGARMGNGSGYDHLEIWFLTGSQAPVRRRDARAGRRPVRGHLPGPRRSRGHPGPGRAQARPHYRRRHSGHLRGGDARPRPASA